MATNQLLQALITGVASFSATNIDDIILLMLFFAQTDDTFRPRHIVAGQYLGFWGLILASLPGYFGGMWVPRPWLGWLGLLPICIGLYRMVASNAEDTDIQTVSQSPLTAKGTPTLLKSLFSPRTYQVAAVTLANGGDNIGIYVPLFANSTRFELGIMLGVFMAMVALWCLIAQYLARHPWFARPLTRYGHRLVPFVLVGLGIFIFVESGTYESLRGL